MKAISKVSKKSILVLLTLALFTLPQGYVPIRPWAYCSLLVLVLSIFDNWTIFRKPIIPLLLFQFVVLLKIIGGLKLNIPYTIFEFVIFSICSALLIIVINDAIFKEKLLKLVLGITLITSVCSIFVMMSNPGLVRQLSSGSEESIQLMNQYFKFGLSSYYFSHAVPAIIPGLIYRIKSKTKHSTYYLLLLFISIYYVFLSGATTPLLLSIILLILSFLINVNKSTKQNLFRLGLMALFLIVIFDKSTILLIIKTIISITPDMFSEFAYKLKAVVVLVDIGDSSGALVSREELHNLSKTSFLNNMFLGIFDSNQQGRHSYILDSLAKFGLIGILPLFLYLKMMVSKTIKNIDKSAKLFYLLGLSYLIVLGYMKGLTGLEVWLYVLVILPILCIINSKNK